MCTASIRGRLNFPLKTGAMASARALRILRSRRYFGIISTAAAMSAAGGALMLRINGPYICELSAHLIGRSEVKEPPTISLGREATSLNTAVPFALKIPNTPSI